jgi:hypothetical protein
MWFTLGMMTGVVIGTLVTGLLAARRVREAENLAEAIGDQSTYLALLRARIRAIQEHGKPMGKGERMYVVQSPNGKFSKLTLPEV